VYELFKRPSEASTQNIQNLVKIPILGRVRAGKPVLSEEHYEGYSYIPEEGIKGDKTKIFGLVIRGNSMEQFGLKDGDLAVAKLQPVADNGDIVICTVGDELYIRKFLLKDSTIYLQSGHPDYLPVIITPEQQHTFRIVGVVIFIQRRIK